MKEKNKTNLKYRRSAWQRLFFFALLAVSSTIAMAQGKVTGKIVDAAGEPVIGASVVVKGTNVGTVTDVNGSFALASVPKEATLVV